jgi:hypothetical protein
VFALAPAWDVFKIGCVHPDPSAAACAMLACAERGAFVLLLLRVVACRRPTIARECLHTIDNSSTLLQLCYMHLKSHAEPIALTAATCLLDTVDRGEISLKQ